MTESVFILGGARTPMTQYVGALKDVSAIDLGATAARGALAKTASSPTGSITSCSATCSRAASTRTTARATSGSRRGCRLRCRR